jgi:hypothetical protein
MQLSQEAIWAKIVEFLPGRERFALTTAIDNKPLATTVDMVLDKEAEGALRRFGGRHREVAADPQESQHQCGAFRRLDPR